MSENIYIKYSFFSTLKEKHFNLIKEKYVNMSENKKEKGNRQFFSYFKYMIFILIFVEILDTYTTNNLNVVVSDIS